MAISLPPSRTAGGAPPTSPAGPDPFVYSCDCPGFKENNPVKFCLRCLSVWVEGLPAVMSGKRLDREMRKAAGILARRLKEDPRMGRLSVRRALEATHNVPYQRR